MLTMVVFAAFSTAAKADELSRDVTESATYSTNNGMLADATTDDNYQSYWYTKKAANKYLSIETVEPVKYLYLCYAFKPSEVVIQTSQDGIEWADAANEYPDEFYHVTYTFESPVSFIRIKGTDESEGKFGIVELKVFTEGTLPDYVQNWQSSYDKVDLMIFSAHPDDEAVFFSGIIPYYSGAMGKKITTVYMTASDPCRRSEALNYQWAMHQTHMPIFAYFEDVFEEDGSGYTKSRWGEKTTIDYMVSIIREKKPEVIVSHDITNGEYGHGNHIFTAECLLKAVALANDPEYHPESYELYGTHQVKKLYLHLYPENTIHIDGFDEPIDEYDGLTAIEAAEIGLLQYASQLRHQVVRIHGDESDFSCYNYGLAYTTVGYDTEGTDMFENIEPEPTATPEPTYTPAPTAAPTLSPTLYAEATAVAEDDGLNKPLKIPPLFTVIGAAIVFLICTFVIILLIKKKS